MITGTKLMCCVFIQVFAKRLVLNTTIKPLGSN